MARAKPKSESGFYSVDLNHSFEHLGFTYKPGAHQVDEALLAIMQNEEGLVANAQPTD